MEEAKEEPGTPPSPSQQEISPPESTPTREKSLVNIYMKLATFPCLILKAIKWRRNNNSGQKAIKKKFQD